MTPEEMVSTILQSASKEIARLIESARIEERHAERERCAKIADDATTGLTGFVESDRMEFAVKNMAKLREAIARRIREGQE